MPAFAAGGFVPLDRPFRERIDVVSDVPGEVTLSTRLSVMERAAIPVHWEICKKPSFAEPERYGLLITHADTYEVVVPLAGLEPGRRYWARFWAGGHWSRAVLLRSASHRRVPRRDAPTQTLQLADY